MSRKSKGPRYYDSKGAYFATLDGERVRLGPGPDTKANLKIAQEAYDDLIEARSAHSLKDRAPAWTILQAWLDWCSQRIEPPPLVHSTLRLYTGWVSDLVVHLGKVLKWGDLTSRHFDEWLASHKPGPGRSGWGPGTVRGVISAMRSACKWAQVSGIVTHSPFGPLGLANRTKRVLYRGKRVAVRMDEHRALVSRAMEPQKKDWAIVLMLLWDTGARPAEIAQARGEEWDPSKGAIVIQPVPENYGRFKLARLGEPRIVYIPTYLHPVIERYVRQRPKGLLFRTQNGEPYTQGALSQRMRSVIRLINRDAGREVVRPDVVTYSYRHSYVTRWVTAGHDPMKLCSLLGTSLSMMHKHYSHLFEDHQTLSRAGDDFSRRASSESRLPTGAPDSFLDDDEDEEEQEY